MTSNSGFNLRGTIRFLVIAGFLLITLGGISAMWDQTHEEKVSVASWIELGAGGVLLLVGLALNAGLPKDQR